MQMLAAQRAELAAQRAEFVAGRTQCDVAASERVMASVEQAPGLMASNLLAEARRGRAASTPLYETITFFTITEQGSALQASCALNDSRCVYAW